MATKAETMYRELIENFPAPGGGGAHVAFFKAGALGYKAKKAENQIFLDVTAAVPEGGRVVTEDEILTGVQKGFTKAMYADLGVGDGQVAATLPKIPRDTFERLVSAAVGVTELDIMKQSPIPLDFPEWEAGYRVLDAIYAPDDILYVGESRGLCKPGFNIKTAAEHSATIRKAKQVLSPHIIVNPLSGKQAPTKADPDKLTYRGDNAVVQWEYMVVEFDEVPLAEQLAFWMVIKLPVVALITSGGKSIHGWVKVSCESRVEWEQEIEQELFPAFLVPLGADALCRNESRMSRMPGHVRQGSGKVQKLLYLAPGGQAVSK